MRFGEFVDINPKIKLKKGSSYPFVEMKDLEPSIRSVFSNYGKEFSGSGSKFEYGDTLFARITPCLENGKTSQFKGHSSPAWGSTEFIVLRGISGKSDNSFIYYFSRSPEFRSHAIQNMVGSSGRQRVPNDAIEKYECEFPPLSDQKAIAHILGTLDDKIELNQKMNQTLEDIAKAIFKSWFVDFDPVRAKAEGRHTGFPPEISNLFPDELVDSEIGEIPKGWVLKPIYDLADFINGAAYKKFEPNKERLGLPIIKIAELKSGVSEQTGFSTVEMGEKYLIRQRDILFSWSGNPDTSIDTFVWQRGDAWLNQHIFKVIPSDNVPRAFLLQLLRSKKPVFTEIARNKQTTGLGHVTVKDLKEMQIALPQLDLFQSALQILEVMHERVFLGEQENLCLSELRDTLLPKLISGELRIPDAEKFLEEAGV